MCGGEKVKSKKSQLVRKNKNPVYNESFHFILPPGYMKSASVVVAVMLKGILNVSHHLISIKLGDVQPFKNDVGQLFC